MEQRTILITIAAIAAFFVIILGGLALMNFQQSTTPIPVDNSIITQSTEPPVDPRSMVDQNDTDLDLGAEETTSSIDAQADPQEPEIEFNTSDSTEPADDEMASESSSEDSVENTNTENNSDDELAEESVTDQVSEPAVTEKPSETVANNNTTSTRTPEPAPTTTSAPARTTQTQSTSSSTSSSSSSTSSSSSSTSSSSSSTRTSDDSALQVTQGPYTQYWIQVGSYSKKQTAEDAKALLLEEGIAGMITSREVGSDTYYRLRIGPYDNKDEATKFLNWIKEIGQFSQSYISRVEVE